MTSQKNINQINKIIKVFFVFIFLFFTFNFSINSVFASVIPKPPNNLGLVGYWSMEDCRSTKATDFSGNGNTGTLTNFALSGSTSNWVSGSSAKRGCAINFDGGNDYVEIADSASLDTIGASSYSYGMWIKTTDPANNTVLMEKGLNQFLLQPANGGSNLFINNGNSVSGGWIPFKDGQWNHLFVVYDIVVNTATLYKNGASIAVVTSAGAPAANNSVLHIGSRAGAIPFNGSIDEVRIYNRALGATEVAALYNSGGTKINVRANAPASLGLVGSWSFDDQDISGTTAIDRSSRGNNGTLTNGPVPTIGKVGQALSFDGVDDKVVTTASMDQNEEVTLSAWIKTNNIGTSQFFISNNPSSGADFDYSLTVNYAGSGKLAMGWGDSAVSAAGVTYMRVVATTAIAANTWYHVVGVRSGSAGNWTGKIYINGALDATITGITNNPSSVNQNTTIGGANNWAGSQFFNGSLDEARIYNRALSADEISQLYNSQLAGIVASGISGTKANASQNTQLTSGLVGLWSFNGPDLTTTTATDRSGQGNNGTLTNGPVPTIGKVGQALSFDGVDDAVDVGSSLALTPTTGFTLSAWIYINGANANYGTIYASWSPSAAVFIGTGLGDSTIIQVYFNGALNFQITSVPRNQWLHLVVTNNGATAVAYINGVQVGTAAAALSSNSGRKSIGFDVERVNYPFKGNIDEARIYNRALSADEVRQLYNMGR